MRASDMRRRRSFPRAVVASASIALLTQGCGSVLLPAVTPPESSPEIQHLMQHRESFAQSDGDPLVHTAPGTIVDDLSRLDGCFGAYHQFMLLGVPLEGFEVYAFEPDTGHLRYQVLDGPAYAEFELAYSVTGPDRISIRRVLSNGQEKVVDALVTLSGSRLKIAYLSDGGEPLDGTSGETNDSRAGLVFKRFGCP